MNKAWAGRIVGTKYSRKQAVADSTEILCLAHLLRNVEVSHGLVSKNSGKSCVHQLLYHQMDVLHSARERRKTRADWLRELHDWGNAMRGNLDMMTALRGELE